jgi:hypothetical protein
MKKINILLLISSFVAFFVVAQTIIHQNTGLVPQAVHSTPGAINPELVKTFKIDSLELEKVHSKEFYENWLKQEEAVVWKEIEAVFGITKQQCDELKAQWHDEYVALVDEMIKQQRAADKPTEENQALGTSILREFGLNPAVIEIVPWKEPVSGGSTDRTVFINEKRIASMPADVKKFLMGHEISHVLNKDHSTDFVLAKLRVMKNIPESAELTNALNNFSYFKELRADITAMLHGPDYIKGQIMYMEHQIKGAEAAGDADSNDPTYPSDKLRQTIGKQLQIALK